MKNAAQLLPSGCGNRLKSGVQIFCCFCRGICSPFGRTSRTPSNAFFGRNPSGRRSPANRSADEPQARQSLRVPTMPLPRSWAAFVAGPENRLPVFALEKLLTGEGDFSTPLSGPILLCSWDRQGVASRCWSAASRGAGFRCSAPIALPTSPRSTSLANSLPLAPMACSLSSVHQLARLQLLGDRRPAQAPREACPASRITRLAGSTHRFRMPR